MKIKCVAIVACVVIVFVLGTITILTFAGNECATEIYKWMLNFMPDERYVLLFVVGTLIMTLFAVSVVIGLVLVLLLDGVNYLRRRHRSSTQ